MRYNEILARLSYFGLIEKSLLPIFWIGTDGVLLHANSAACGYLGYSYDELLNRSLGDIDLNFSFKDFIGSISNLKVNRIVRFETVHRRKDGSLVHVEVVRNYVDEHDTEMVISYIFDITDKKEKERELANRTEELRLLNSILEQKVFERTKELEEHKAILEERVEQETAIRRKQESIIFAQQRFVDMSKMLSNIAHHWRQPLNSLSLLVQNICELHQEKQDDDASFEFFNDHSTALLAQLSDMINQFCVFFRNEEGKTDFDLLRAVGNVADIYRSGAADKGIEIGLVCSCGGYEEEYPCKYFLDGCAGNRTVMRGYEWEVKQVLLSVLENSIEAIERRGVEKGTIGICITAQDSGFEISVTDNGGGIADENIHRVFDPYFTTKKEAKAKGLGLYMSRVIVEDHFNGTITAFNTENGAKVLIFLPSV